MASFDNNLEVSYPFMYFRGTIRTTAITHRGICNAIRNSIEMIEGNLNRNMDAEDSKWCKVTIYYKGGKQVACVLHFHHMGSLRWCFSHSTLS